MLLALASAHTGENDKMHNEDVGSLTTRRNSVPCPDEASRWDCLQNSHYKRWKCLTCFFCFQRLCDIDWSSCHDGVTEMSKWKQRIRSHTLCCPGLQMDFGSFLASEEVKWSVVNFHRNAGACKTEKRRNFTDCLALAQKMSFPHFSITPHSPAKTNKQTRCSRGHNPLCRKPGSKFAGKERSPEMLRIFLTNERRTLHLHIAFWIKQSQAKYVSLGVRPYFLKEQAWWFDYSIKQTLWLLNQLQRLFSTWTSSD